MLVGPDTQKVMKDRLFRDSLSCVERRAYDAVIKTVEIILRKNRNLVYIAVVAELLDSF